MKVSLSWIFDHIASHKVRDINVHDFVQSLSGMPAEIDHIEEVNFSWDDFSIGKVQGLSEKGGIRVIELESAEWRKQIAIHERGFHCKSFAAGDEKIGGYFLIKRHKVGSDLAALPLGEYDWATLTDLGSTKYGLVPELTCTDEEYTGAWKKRLPTKDYILHIDNKSITNRPDLWSHRGMAREMCALLGYDLVPEENILHSLPIQHYATKTDASAAYSIGLESETCDRFAGLEMTCVQKNGQVPTSLLWMVARLACVDTRARNLIVDATNYVMFDIGQPMHAFDAEKIHNKTIRIRPAVAGEKLAVLDDTILELTPPDCVVADDRQALSLAGIIGGASSAVQQTTKKIFLESAHFEGTAIRLSSARHKKRTESSIRFEKVLDPHNNTTALLRYVKLLDDASVDYTLSTPVISVGNLAPERIITIEYKFLIDRLGISLAAARVEELLRRLGFGVTSSEGPLGSTYKLIVPTWRAGKDITIKEDILEEIGRCFGYTNMRPVLPSRVMIPQDYRDVYMRRKIKQYWAFALRMREVCNYPLYDDQFLNRIGLVIPTAFELKNPVSENLRRMVTSLVPHLLKNVEQNCANQATLRFFEWGRIWLYNKDHAPDDEMKGVSERVVTAGIAYSAHGTVDFYEEKAGIQQLFALLGLLVEWRPIKDLKNYAVWMNPLQTAELVCQDTVIGYAGMVASEFVVAVNPIAGQHGNAFACGLFIDVIKSLNLMEHHFSEPSKYQPVDLDISMLVPLNMTIAMLEELLAHVDVRIKDILLLDVFENPSWKDQRSVTMRCHIQDDEKTMTKQDIEEIQQALHQAIQGRGIQVR